MRKLKRSICFSTAFFMILFLTVPVSAAEYNVGVEAGQWIKYGNYVVEDSGDEGTIPVWSKLEVSAVAGPEILFFANGFYRNGTEFYYHMERTIEANTTVIIEANLTSGDRINPAEEARINRTETRSYLGVDRSVNILEFTSTSPTGNYSAVYVYDQITGLLLDYLVEEIVVAEKLDYEYRYSYNIIDTNIFGEKPSTTPEPDLNSYGELIWIGGAIIGIVTIVVVSLIILRKKRNPRKRKQR